MYGNYLHPQDNEEDNSQTGSFNLQSLVRSVPHQRRLGRSRVSGPSSTTRPLRMGESATKGPPPAARRNLGPMRMNAKVESFQSKMSDILTEEDAEEVKDKDVDQSLADAFGPLSLNKSLEESKTSEEEKVTNNSGTFGTGRSPDSGSFTATSTMGQLTNSTMGQLTNACHDKSASNNTSLIGQLKTALGSDFTDKLPERCKVQERPMRMVSTKGPFRINNLGQQGESMRSMEMTQDTMDKVRNSCDKENMPLISDEIGKSKTVIEIKPPTPPNKLLNYPAEQQRESKQSHPQVKVQNSGHDRYVQSQYPKNSEHPHNFPLQNPPKTSNGSELRMTPKAESLQQRLGHLAAATPCAPCVPSMKKTQSMPAMPGLQPLPRTPLPRPDPPPVTQAPPACPGAMMPPPSMAMAQQDTVLVVHSKRYNVMKLLGKGGSSRVYEAFDELNKKVVAIKRVDLSDADEAQAAGYLNEIQMLSQLQGEDRVVKLYDHEKVDAEDILFVVMEKGDTDLSLLLKKYNANREMTPAMVKHYWTEMLHAVQVIHKVGIIHSDLKPANFLLVAGRLKLIDFGIASAVQSDKTSVIKDSQMGTFNFMSPEAIQDVATGPQYDASGTRKPCIKISIKSDVWSLGCILYNLAYGKMPFGEIRHPLMKLQAIVNPDHKINFSTEGQDPLLIDVLKSCLVRDPRGRPSICSLLQHPYVTGVKEKEGQVTTQEALSAINIVANLKLDAVLTPNTLDRTRKGLAEAMEKLGSNSELDVLRKLEL